MKNIKKMLIVLLLGTMISAIEITTRMGLFIIFALGVATIVSSLVLFKNVKFMKNMDIIRKAKFQLFLKEQMELQKLKIKCLRCVLIHQKN